VHTHTHTHTHTYARDDDQPAGRSARDAAPLGITIETKRWCAEREGAGAIALGITRPNALQVERDSLSRRKYREILILGMYVYAGLSTGL
jgi:hypothetical protein